MKWALWLLCVLLVSACAQSQRSTVSPTEVRPTLGSSTIAPTEPSPTEPVPTPVEPAATRPPAAPESTPQAARPAFTLAVEPVASGFERPTYVTHAGDDGLFVVEQAGSIRIVEDGAVLDIPFLSIASKVNSQAYERGLLSVAFDPDYASNGFFYVNYTRQPDGATVIERYQVSDNPGAADPDSGAVLLIIDQPEANHNGGQLQFGPDGYLYIGMGDGGGAGDRHGTIGNGQDLDALLGKMLRIDVDGGEPYAIPASNPFVDSTDARPEIWAFGIRNPWRFSFDRATGDLYIADVGQNAYEEVNFQAASSAGGENYGWRIMEGAHCFNPREGCDQTGLTLPVAEYGREGGCSVTGGYVYRGSLYPWLDGVYFFADYCSGNVWSLERDASGQWNMTGQMRVNFNVSSFGEDEAGELYLVGHDDGTIYRLTSTSP